VKLHRNAKTTPAIRALLQERVRHHGWSVSRTAIAYCVSRRTVYRWLGRTALADRSSRPHAQPRRTSALKVAAILALRAARWPAWRIAIYVQVPRSTVSAILARRGLQRIPTRPAVRTLQHRERR
jgi:transposase